MKRTVKIKITGRSGLIYEDECRRKMQIFSEMLVGGEYDMVVYERSIVSWLPPYDGNPVTEEERGKIKKNIEEYFKRWRIDWQG